MTFITSNLVPFLDAGLQELSRVQWLHLYVSIPSHTQVNRMSRSRRVLATGGKQRILRLDMVCIKTILFHLNSC